MCSILPALYTGYFFASLKFLQISWFVLNCDGVLGERVDPSVTEKERMV